MIIYLIVELPYPLYKHHKYLLLWISDQLTTTKIGSISTGSHSKSNQHDPDRSKRYPHTFLISSPDHRQTFIPMMSNNITYNPYSAKAAALTPRASPTSPRIYPLLLCTHGSRSCTHFSYPYPLIFASRCTHTKSELDSALRWHPRRRRIHACTHAREGRVGGRKDEDELSLFLSLSLPLSLAMERRRAKRLADLMNGRVMWMKLQWPSLNRGALALYSDLLPLLPWQERALAIRLDPLRPHSRLSLPLSLSVRMRESERERERFRCVTSGTGYWLSRARSCCSARATTRVKLHAIVVLVFFSSSFFLGGWGRRNLGHSESPRERYVLEIYRTSAWRHLAMIALCARGYGRMGWI